MFPQQDSRTDSRVSGTHSELKLVELGTRLLRFSFLKFVIFSPPWFCMTSSNELCFALGGAGRGAAAERGGRVRMPRQQSRQHQRAERDGGPTCGGFHSVCSFWTHNPRCDCVFSRIEEGQTANKCRAGADFQFGTEAEPRGALHYSAAASLTHVSETPGLL